MKKVLYALSFAIICLLVFGACASDVDAVETIPETTIETTVPLVEFVPEETIEEVIETETISAPEPEPQVDFSFDITYEYEYVRPDDMMNYILYTPSMAETNEKTPLILWLHCNGRQNCEEVDLRWNGLSKYVTAWDFTHLEGFNAYVLVPHLHTPFYFSTWNQKGAQDAVQQLLDYIIDNYNIDTDRIYVSGHSLGGQGTLYMANALPDYFAAQLILSAYNPVIKLTNTEIPTWCFQGQTEHGESKLSVTYATTDFARAYGRDCITSLPCSHGELPEETFMMDSDGNTRSDPIEWMMAQRKGQPESLYDLKANTSLAK